MTMHSNVEASWIPLCPSAALVDGSAGVRFPVLAGGIAMTGFAVRYGSTVHAYLNRCAHVPMELDWVEGRFFDADGAALICSTHGAVYTPDTGVCIGGPCCGSRLRAIVVLERDGQVYWCPDDYVEPAIADAMATQQSDHNGQSGI